MTYTSAWHTIYSQSNIVHEYSSFEIFSISVINDWNSLSDHIIHAPSISSFKEQLESLEYFYIIITMFLDCIYLLTSLLTCIILIVI